MFRGIAKFHVLVLLSLPMLCAVAAESHGPYREVASADQRLQPSGARLTLAGALHLAEADARRHRIIFSDFQGPWFWYREVTDQRHTWVFIYEGKVPALGKQLMVIVDDRTQHVEFVPGK
jgi:hypothetical protein